MKKFKDLKIDDTVYVFNDKILISDEYKVTRKVEEKGKITLTLDKDSKDNKLIIDLTPVVWNNCHLNIQTVDLYSDKKLFVDKLKSKEKVLRFEADLLRETIKEINKTNQLKL